MQLAKHVDFTEESENGFMDFEIFDSAIIRIAITRNELSNVVPTVIAKTRLSLSQEMSNLVRYSFLP